MQRFASNMYISTRTNKQQQNSTAQHTALQKKSNRTKICQNANTVFEDFCCLLHIFARTHSSFITSTPKEREKALKSLYSIVRPYSFNYLFFFLIFVNEWILFEFFFSTAAEPMSLCFLEFDAGSFYFVFNFLNLLFIWTAMHMQL